MAAKNAMMPALSFVGGIPVGIVVNDLYEMAKLPGYYVTAFSIGDVNIGYDDIAQFLLGLGIAGVGMSMKSPLVTFGGLGVTVGGLATKTAEIMGTKLQIIPHPALPP